MISLEAFPSPFPTHHPLIPTYLLAFIFFTTVMTIWYHNNMYLFITQGQATLFTTVSSSLEEHWAQRRHWMATKWLNSSRTILVTQNQLIIMTQGSKVYYSLAVILSSIHVRFTFSFSQIDKAQKSVMICPILHSHNWQNQDWNSDLESTGLAQNFVQFFHKMALVALTCL